MADVENFTAFPNPTTTSGKVNFAFGHSLNGSNITTKIQILDLAGRLVRELNWTTTEAAARLGANGELEWDLRNENGSFVSNALYIAKLYATGGGNTATATLKVVVQR